MIIMAYESFEIKQLHKEPRNRLQKPPKPEKKKNNNKVLYVNKGIKFI